ncbi:hypothetical protein VTK56DRAFT_993 [Thermocarpiscus australiensis]
MLYQSQRKTHHVIETTGVCTGVLPAILAAAFSSYASDAFVSAAVEGARLAFWIGVRAASMYTERTPDDAPDKTCSCVLSVFGVSEARMGELFEAYAAEGKGYFDEVRISAVFSDTALSLSGHGIDLQNIKAFLNARSVECRWAHIHALYHRDSPQSEAAVRTILSDVERRKITFPGLESLHAPVLSSADGRHMSPNPSTPLTSTGLLEQALRNIFTERVDWKRTSTKLRDSITTRLRGDSSAAYRIIGLGPGSRSLLEPLQGSSPLPGLIVVDDSAMYLAPAPDDIAVIGLSINVPGAKGQQQFWQLLSGGVSTVTEIPSTRFQVQHSEEANGRVHHARHGNFLTDPFKFDPAYFNLSPREAKSMDPQQRLVLMSALEALEDAGYAPDSTPSFQRARVGVYMGVATGDYVDNLRDDIDVYYSPGTLRAFISGRISYAFKFGGPSMVIDTACSSSLVAVYHACMALRAGDCSTALAGGVNAMTSPDMYSGLSRAHFLSPSGQCKPFDEAADGYCRAEGCAVVVLKRLSDAVAEGDHVYGVIRGISVNQCGMAKSITHPHSETQAALMKSVLQSARASPRSISVVEAHGTGTQAGDAAEMASIRTVFCPRTPEQPLYVSSLKGNIGHLEAASGVASLAKLLLMMNKKQIPAQASFIKLNPRLPATSPGQVTIPTRMTEWKRTAGQRTPRRALLNNFGASGSNAALVLEEFDPQRSRSLAAQQQDRPQEVETEARPTRSHHVLNISAKTAGALETARRNMISYLTEHPDVVLNDLCYTTNARRQEYPDHRLSIIVSDRSQIIDQLRQPLEENARPRPEQPHKTVFVFSGQGGVYPGMGAELLSTVPFFRSLVNECDETLATHGFPTVAAFLANSEPQSASSETTGDQVIVSQCACFVLEYALAMMWRHWNVSPDLVIGHSIGEYAAFAFAGMLSMKDALLLLARRARLMASKCTPHATGMVACRLPREALGQLLAEYSHDLKDITISCFNSPHDSVLAGPLTSLAKLVQHCKDQGIWHKRLNVPYGFHSPAMEPILYELSQASRSIPFRRSCLLVGSSLRGRLFGASEMIDADYFVRHAREPVNFCGVVENALQALAGCYPIFIEIGPSPSTESMLKQIITSQNYSFLSSLSPTRAAWQTLSTALRELSLRRYSIRWRQVYDGSQARFITGLPGYPLNLSSYIVPYKPLSGQGRGSGESNQQDQEPRYAFLTTVSTAEGDPSLCRASTAMNQVREFIEAHQVGEVPLCPASVYLEVAAQALAHHAALDIAANMFMLENIKFDHPLIGTGDGRQHNSAPAIQTTLIMHSVDGHSYTCSSASGETLCAGGVRSLQAASQAAADILARRQGRVARLKRSLDDVPRGLRETFSGKTIYHLIFPRVVQYGKRLMTLHQFTTATSHSEGYGVFELPAVHPVSSGDGRFVTCPAFADTLLHAPGFMANTLVGPDTACICVALEQALLPSDGPSLHQQPLRIYCSLVDIEHSFIADAYALDAHDKVVGYMEGICFKKLKLEAFKAHLSRQLAHRPDPARRPGVAAGRAKTAISVPMWNAPPAAASRGRSRGHSARSTRAQSPESVAKSSDLAMAVYSTIRDLCGLDCQPTGTTTLTELGLDSLLCVELSQALSEIAGCDISHDQLQEFANVAEILDFVIKSQSVASSDSSSSGQSTANSSVESSPQGREAAAMDDDERVMPSALRSELASLIRSVCGVLPDDLATPLSALGVDSLLSIELCQALEAKLGITVDNHAIVGDLTYRQLEGMCAAKLAAAAAPPPATGAKKAEVGVSTPCTSAGLALYQLNEKRKSHDQEVLSPKTSSRTTSGMVRLLQKRSDGGGRHDASGLYLFHDGSGSCGMYSQLGYLGRDVYGIPSSSSDAQTLEGLAADYIRQANLDRRDDLILGGWSFGGVLAFEVSRQLVLRHGRTVKGVILIDSPAPVDHQALPGEVVRYVLTTKRASALHSAAAKGLQATVEANFSRHAAMLEDYSRGTTTTTNQAGHGDDARHSVPCIMLRCLKTLDLAALCNVDYPWLSDVDAADRSIRAWERLLGRPLPVLNLNCDHFSPFEPENVGELSLNLRVACEMLEGSDF